MSYFYQESLIYKRLKPSLGFCVKEVNHVITFLNMKEDYEEVWTINDHVQLDP